MQPLLESRADELVQLSLLRRMQTAVPTEQSVPTALCESRSHRSSEEPSMTRKKEACIAALGVCAAGLVLAQAAPSFESLDKNSDGQISIQEATTHDQLFVAFKKLDTNKDGALSKQEFAAYSKQ
jgi:hypothetical protein